MTSHTYNFGGALPPFLESWGALAPLAPPSSATALVTIPNNKKLIAIGGKKNNDGVSEISNKVFLWDDKKRKWTTPYPNMPTARYWCSSISHGSTVIVAGGVTCSYSVTRAVEILHIRSAASHWSVVEQLPFAVYETIPLIVNNKLYLAQGYDAYGGSSTCNVLAAPLPELLQSNDNNIGSCQVWKKLPDMPYSSFSINHYQGHLITFGGGHKVEHLSEDKPVYELVPLIHTYNPYTNIWDCVGDIPHGYLLGRSVHISEIKFSSLGV